MTSACATALLHNTATRITLGNTPLHAVPARVAHQLRPLLACSTSLAFLTIHTQFTPPESLRLLLLGAARCRSLQHIRLVGGVSVLQSKMIMTALTHFTFAPRPHTPLSARQLPPPRRGVGNPSASVSPRAHRAAVCVNGVRVALELHRVDEVAVGLLLRGLERSERIIALDVCVAPTSQSATRAAARLLTRAAPFVARNGRRLQFLCRRAPSDFTAPTCAPLAASLEAHTPPRRYSIPRFTAKRTPTRGNRKGTPIRKGTPSSPPSPRGQAVQQLRVLRGCVMDINACVVRYQISSRDVVGRLAADLRGLEDELAERITTKLTDMTVVLTDMEK